MHSNPTARPKDSAAATNFELRAQMGEKCFFYFGKWLIHEFVSTAVAATATAVAFTLPTCI
jgi:hypothetical protein